MPLNGPMRTRSLLRPALEPYVSRFSRHQLLVARFEDIIERPAALADTVQRFIGVTPRPKDTEGLGVINPSEQDLTGLADGLRRQLSERYREPNRRLAVLLGRDFQMWT